ncbi:MAG: hypothetical protein IT215_00085 [Chitinophagaceae bacterium]|nr:hypothetical protein [Chitinophagaceae bacterium]
MENNSKPGQLNKTDWKSIGKSLVLTLGGVVAIALADWLAKLDLVELFGNLAPYIAVVIPFIINFLRRWGGGTK